MRLLLILSTLTLIACKPSMAERDAFLKPGADKGAGLDPQQFYPQGRRMVYAGYSGQGERDLANGFTVVGPAYGGNNERQAASCEKAKLPYMLQVVRRLKERLTCCARLDSWAW